MESRRVEIETSPLGLVPELVVVLETVGSIDEFQRAVRNTPGMEWLGEWDEEDLPADEDFTRVDGRSTRLDGRLYLVLGNQAAMREVLSLWRRYERDDSPIWPRGQTKWRDLFAHLRTVRLWDAHDRLDETGLLEEWEELVREGRSSFRAEVELWFRDGVTRRHQTSTEVRAIIEREGGQVRAESQIPEARYHALLAEMPTDALRGAFDSGATRLVGAQNVMFLRPVGQAAILLPTDPPLGPAAGVPEPLVTDAPPLVALFDGLPMANHAELAGRLLIDDPDDYESAYAAGEQSHGTAMASLIAHGELDARTGPLERQIYVRPVMKPDGPDWLPRARYERIPPDVLEADLLHRAVRRLFEDDGEGGPVAPTVRVINWSIGDPSRPFDRLPSSTARVMDWLADKYNVLFIVSAGNYPAKMIFDCDDATLRATAPDELEQRVVGLITDEMAYRRILSPAEAINAITVGATHSDNSTFVPSANVMDVYVSNGMPSPINRLGPGIRRGIKPDLLAPGGRQIYQLGPEIGPPVSLSAVMTLVAPGQRVAAPGRFPADLNATRYTRGTSNATALTTRTAARVAEVLDELRNGMEGQGWGDSYTPLLIRGLLAHGSSWGDSAPILTAVLRGKGFTRPKPILARHLGFGLLDPSRSISASDERAVLLGWGQLREDEAAIHSLPLPPCLASRTDWRRLTVTLTWFTSINAGHRGYRRAHLWFEPPSGPLDIDRRESDNRLAKQGTLQHEVFEGERASAYIDGDEVSIRVSCRRDAGEFARPILYSLAVSLEVKESVPLPIYEEIEARVRVRVRPIGI